MSGRKEWDPESAFSKNHNGRFLRLMAPEQAYWRRQFAKRSVLYKATPEVVFVVVDARGQNLHGQWPEIMWLYPEEVRLLTAVALAILEGRGALRFTPSERRHRIEGAEGPLDDPTVQKALTNRACELAAAEFCATTSFELRDAEGSDEAFQDRLFGGDDYFETYEALISVYRHLLTGEDGRATAFV